MSVRFRPNFIQLLPHFVLLVILVHPNGSIEYKYQKAKPDPHRCAFKKYDEDGTFKYALKPSAMACLDELPPFPEETEGDPDKSLCENIFQSTKEKKADGNLPLRPEACDNEWIQPLANKCRKTCKTCCELPQFQCENKAKSNCDGVDGILYKGHQTSVWHPILIEHCPASVGLCEVAKKLEEEKKQREEEEEAEMYKGASSSSLIPIEADCENEKPDSYCEARVKRCDQERILNFCPKTCGECLPKGFVCRDRQKHERRCKAWAKKGFCRRDDSNKHPLGILLKYCPKTCKLCESKLGKFKKAVKEIIKEQKFINRIKNSLKTKEEEKQKLIKDEAEKEEKDEEKLMSAEEKEVLYKILGIEWSPTDPELKFAELETAYNVVMKNQTEKEKIDKISHAFDQLKKNKMKLYKIVGITEGSPTAIDELTLSDLKKAYKEAALRCHPDKNLNDKKATEKFIKLKDAFDQLTKGMQG